VTDFGLAKRLAGGPAPEQAGGAKAALTVAADVYSLGAILYEMLTGRPPFQAETPLETLALVKTQEPVPPRRLQPRVPRDLETVCLKCLQKEPGRRYASAAELADDLERFLAGEPIRARPVGTWERAVKWARRRPAVAALLLALVAVVGGGLAGLTALWLQAERNLTKAQVAEAKTQAINRFLTDDLLMAARPEEQGREVTMRQALDAALPKLDKAFGDQPEVEASVRHTVGSYGNPRACGRETESGAWAAARVAVVPTGHH
jgi:hypothetical protein